MINNSPFTPSFTDLPGSLPVFPLSNAILMPGSRLPLNIFEPRYITMVQDVMRGDQLIGMIQPSDKKSPPNLYRVGCAGRITHYEETSDGRLGIVLSGLCRFEATQEMSSSKDYRIVVPDWSEFAKDYQRNDTPSSQIALLFNGALRNYLNNSNIEVDWQAWETLDVNDLANSVLSYLPISPEEKQILVETNTLEDRLVAFTAILDEDNSTLSIQH